MPPIWRNILRLSFATALMNAPWLIIGQWIFVSRAVVNLDYFLVALVAPFSLLAGALVLTITFLFDAVVSNSIVYHFTSPADFLKASKFLATTNFAGFFEISDFLILLPFITCGVLALSLLRRPTGLIPVLLVGGVMFSIDVGNGSSAFSLHSRQYVGANPAGSGMFTVVRASALSNKKSEPISILDEKELLRNPSDLIKWAQDHPDKSVLLVIVESWGLNRDADIREWIADRLLTPSIRRHYKIDERTLPFRGATTSGELRHLCGLQGRYGDLTPQLATRCLPARFAELGHVTVGAHGFSKRMFDRKKWWSTIGLQRLLFVDELLAAGSPYCGSTFRGACDNFIIEFLGKQLSDQPGFYYHLTLNSHFPILKASVPKDLHDRCVRTETSESACTLTATIGDYFSELAAMIEKLSNKPMVLIVGDHAPPFSKKSDHQKYSLTYTPGFVLTPK